MSSGRPQGSVSAPSRYPLLEVLALGMLTCAVLLGAGLYLAPLSWSWLALDCVAVAFWAVLLRWRLPEDALLARFLACLQLGFCVGLAVITLVAVATVLPGDGIGRLSATARIGTLAALLAGMLFVWRNAGRSPMWLTIGWLGMAFYVAFLVVIHLPGILPGPLNEAREVTYARANLLAATFLVLAMAGWIVCRWRELPFPARSLAAAGLAVGIGMLVDVLDLVRRFGMSGTDSVFIGLLLLALVALVVGGIAWARRGGMSKSRAFAAAGQGIALTFAAAIGLACQYAETAQHDGPSRFLVMLDNLGLNPFSDQRTMWLVMRDSYLWHENVPGLAGQADAKLDRLLEALRDRKRDRFSYVVDRAEAAELARGVYRGLGLSWKRDAADDIRVGFVHAGSPADRAEVKRGMKVVAINGKALQGRTREEQADLIFGEIERHDEISLLLEHRDAARRHHTMRKDEVRIKHVPLARVLQDGARNVGYLVYQNFHLASGGALRQAFADFRRRGITELVLDLRYNGGGAVMIADDLVRLIAGSPGTEGVIQRTVFNPRYRSHGLESRLYSLPQSLGLRRVVVLTTGQTCSASELVINSLRPYLDVITVGTPTCGKPFGMTNLNFRNWLFAPLNARIQNARGESDYDTGMVPECGVADDLTREFGNPEEGMLKEALSILRTGKCSVARTRGEPGPPDSDISLTGFRREIGAH